MSHAFLPQRMYRLITAVLGDANQQRLANRLAQSTKGGAARWCGFEKEERGELGTHFKSMHKTNMEQTDRRSTRATPVNVDNKPRTLRRGEPHDVDGQWRPPSYAGSTPTRGEWRTPKVTPPVRGRVSP